MPAELSKLPALSRAGYFVTNLFSSGFLWLMVQLPYRWRVPLMGWIVAHVFSPVAGYKNRIRQNLALTHPDMSEAEVRRLCNAVPDNAGRTLIEIYSPADFKTQASKAEIEGPGYAAFTRAREAGKPVLLAPAHFGNYLALRAKLQSEGYEVGALYRRMANPFFNEHYLKTMRQTGEALFEQGPTGMRGMIRHLKSGGALAILHDVHVQGGHLLTFFGQAAATSLSLADLAIRFDAEVIPCYCIRQPDGLTFQLVMNAPIAKSDPATMMQALNDDLEHMVRNNMEQWFWIHRRWKPFKGRRQPVGDG